MSVLISVLVDGHGHLYPQHDVENWLQQAFSRIKQINPTAFCGVICITESDNEGAWRRLVEEPEHGYTIEPLTVNSAWLVYHIAEEERRILLIRGRQYKSIENIEVLAIDADLPSIDQQQPQQLSLSELTELVYENGGTAVVPWGFGKWMGRRGIVVRDWVANTERGFIGDNGGRPQWFDGKVLDLWFNRERLDFAGSDPLSLKGHEQTNMRTVLEVNVSPSIFEQANPAGALMQVFSEFSARSPHYRLLAERPSFMQFLSDQLRLRLNK